MSGRDIAELTLNENVTLTIKNRTTPKDIILVSAENPFMNFTFYIDVDFHKEHDNEEE